MKEKDLLTENIPRSYKEPIAIRIAGIIFSLIIAMYFVIVLTNEQFPVFLRRTSDLDTPIIVGVLILLFSIVLVIAPLRMYRRLWIRFVAYLLLILLVIAGIAGIILAFLIFAYNFFQPVENYIVEYAEFSIKVFGVAGLLAWASALIILLRLRWARKPR